MGRLTLAPMSTSLTLKNPALTEWRLPIEGMTCASCVSRVEKALRQVPGVLSAEVNLATETADVTVAGGAATLPQLIAAVDKAGYRAEALQDSGATHGPVQQPGASWWPIAVAAEGLPFVRRYSGGPDIHAACGMLAARRG